jgi:hypothetical protein
MWVISFLPPPLYSGGKSPRYPLHRRLCGHQSRSGDCEENKKFLDPVGIETSITRPFSSRSPSLNQLTSKPKRCHSQVQDAMSLLTIATITNRSPPYIHHCSHPTVSENSCPYSLDYGISKSAFQRYDLQHFEHLFLHHIFLFILCTCIT